MISYSSLFFSFYSFSSLFLFFFSFFSQFSIIFLYLLTISSFLVSNSIQTFSVALPSSSQSSSSSSYFSLFSSSSSFSSSSLSLLPQMFTKLWRGTLPSPTNSALNKVFDDLMKVNHGMVLWLLWQGVVVAMARCCGCYGKVLWLLWQGVGLLWQGVVVAMARCCGCYEIVLLLLWHGVVSTSWCCDAPT